jgi:Tol biopolymer transport system component
VVDPETLIVLPMGDLPANFHPERPETNATQVGFNWYPDSKHIAVSITTRKNEHGILAIRADEPGMETQGLFGSAGYTVSPMHPVVSPDGTQLAFEAWRMDSAENRELLGIAVITTDPSKIVRVLTAADLPKLTISIKAKATMPQWSPDGSRLLYMMTNANGTRDLWIAKADGYNPINLTRGKGDNFDASWSPLKK